MWLTDLVVVALAVRTGLVFVNGHLQVWLPPPGAMGVLSGLVLVAALIVRRLWDPRILGQGYEEYRRLVAATVVLTLIGLAVDIGFLRP